MPVVTLDATNTSVIDGHVINTAPNNPGTFVNEYISLNANAFALFGFNMGLIPNGAVITNAILYLNTATSYVQNGTRPIAQNVLNEIKTETSSNSLQLGEEIRNVGMIEGRSGRFPLNITPIVQSWVNGQGYGVMLKTEDASQSSVIISSESANNKPQLTIEYTFPTDKKQVEFVNASVDLKILHPSEGARVVPYPPGTQKGDLVVVSIMGNVNEKLDNFNPLYDFEIDRPRYLKAYSKIVGDEASFPIYALQDIVNISVLTFRNAINVSKLPSEVSKYGPSTTSMPLETRNIPENVLVVSSHGYPIDNPVTTPKNATRYLSGSNSNGTQTIFGIYNHKKTSFTPSEMAVTRSGNPYHNGAVVFYVTPGKNAGPTIDGQDEFVGAFQSVLKKSYTVTDAEGDNVTIVEKVNGRVLANKTGAGDHLLDLSSLWEQLPLGKHRVTVETNDDYNNPPHTPNVRTWDFIKLLPPNAEEEKVIKGVGDAENFIDGMKRKLSDKVNGNEGDKFEQLIEKIRKISDGTALSSATLKSFIRNSGVAANESYISIDTTSLGFKPKHIVIWPANKMGLHTFNWFDTDFYRNGSEYANYMGYNYGFRVPYASTLEIPVPTTNALYNWMAIG